MGNILQIPGAPRASLLRTAMASPLRALDCLVLAQAQYPRWCTATQQAAGNMATLKAWLYGFAWQGSKPSPDGRPNIYVDDPASFFIWTPSAGGTISDSWGDPDNVPGFTASYWNLDIVAFDAANGIAPPYYPGHFAQPFGMPPATYDWQIPINQFDTAFFDTGINLSPARNPILTTDPLLQGGVATTGGMGPVWLPNGGAPTPWGTGAGLIVNASGVPYAALPANSAGQSILPPGAYSSMMQLGGSPPPVWGNLYGAVTGAAGTPPTPGNYINGSIQRGQVKLVAPIGGPPQTFIIINIQAQGSSLTRVGCAGYGTANPGEIVECPWPANAETVSSGCINYNVLFFLGATFWLKGYSSNNGPGAMISQTCPGSYADALTALGA